MRIRHLGRSDASAGMVRTMTSAEVPFAGLQSEFSNGLQDARGSDSASEGTKDDENVGYEAKML